MKESFTEPLTDVQSSPESSNPKGFLSGIWSFLHELLKDLKNATVAMLVWSQNIISIVILLFFVGNKGDEEVSGIVSFGVSWINITVFFPMAGCSAFVTAIISQEIGKKNYSCIFPIMYKSIIINLIVFFISFTFLIATTPLTYKWLGLFEGAYLKGAIFTIQLAVQGIPMGMFFSISFVLLSLNKSNALAGILVIGILSYFLLCLGLIQYGSGSLFCISIIPTLQFAILAILTSLYMLFSGDENIQKNKQLPNKDSFSNFFKTFKSALISGINITLEWTGEEINIMLSTIFGNAGISAFSALYYLNVLSWSIGNGLSTCTAMQMANALGAGDIVSAKKYIKRTYRYSVISSIIFGSFLFLTRNRMGGWFYPEEDIQKIVNQNMWILCMTSSMENLEVSIGNVIRNIGWFHKNAFSCLVSYYAIALPFTLVLIFWAGMEVDALLIGWGIGGVFLSLFNLGFLVNINFKAEIQRIKQQMEEGSVLGKESIVGSFLRV